jgi:hypothetical protein
MFWDEVDFLMSLVKNEATFVIVGGAAVEFHGFQRPRKDLDVLVGDDPANAARVVLSMRLEISDQINAKRLLSGPFGQFRYRDIDVLSSIGGVTFEEARRDAVLGWAETLMVPFISKEHLIRSKKLRGEQVDLDDIRKLTAAT